jgi:hypothetical protein
MRRSRGRLSAPPETPDSSLEYNPTTETIGESLEWLPKELRGGDVVVSDLRL